MEPIFTIVIPTYNRAKELHRALESVFAQSFEYFEIMVMDDGSTDNTADVVASFSDKRITYEWNENFGGPARPRNRGIELANAEWVCFLDADDWWTPDKLQSCFDIISDNVDLIYHDLWIVADQYQSVRHKATKSWQLKSPVLKELLLRGNAISNSSVVVRTGLLRKIGGFSETVEMIAAEDYNAWLRIAELTDHFIYLPRRLGYYLNHKESISQKDMMAPSMAAISDFVYLLKKEQIRKINIDLRYNKGRFYYLDNNYVQAKKNLLFVLKYAKLRLKIKALWFLVMVYYYAKS